MAFLKAGHTIHEMCYDTAKIRINAIVPKHNQYPRAGILIQTVSPREVQGVTLRPSKNSSKFRVCPPDPPKVASESRVLPFKNNFEIQEPSTFQKYVQNESKNVQKLH